MLFSRVLESAGIKSFVLVFSALIAFLVGTIPSYGCPCGPTQYLIRYDYDASGNPTAICGAAVGCPLTAKPDTGTPCTISEHTSSDWEGSHPYWFQSTGAVQFAPFGDEGIEGGLPRCPITCDGISYNNTSVSSSTHDYTTSIWVQRVKNMPRYECIEESCNAETDVCICLRHGWVCRNYNAGGCSASSPPIKIDSVAPHCQMSYSTNDWTTQNVTVVASCQESCYCGNPDYNSGCAGGGGSHAFTQNGSFSGFSSVSDAVGNVGSCSTASVNWIDRGMPVLLSASQILITNKETITTLSFQDTTGTSLSGLASAALKISDSAGEIQIYEKTFSSSSYPTAGPTIGNISFTHNFSKAQFYDLSYNVCDLAGNCTGWQTETNFFHIIADEPTFDESACSGDDYYSPCPSNVSYDQSDSTVIADGSDTEYYSVTLSLSDRYGNPIVSEPNGTRDVQIKFNFENSTALDQAIRGGDSIRFSSLESFPNIGGMLNKNPGGQTTGWLKEVSSSPPFSSPGDGIYEIRIHSYAPTSSGYRPISSDNFGIQLKNIEYDISGYSCTPNCLGKNCGNNGCGGSCGSCVSPTTCSNGECVLSCTPNCSGKDCGDDDCGGSCGTCSSGLICSSSGVCILSASSCTSHHHKDCYNDDVYWYDSCGAQEEKIRNCAKCGGAICTTSSCEPLCIISLSASPNPWYIDNPGSGGTTNVNITTRTSGPAVSCSWCGIPIPCNGSRMYTSGGASATCNFVISDSNGNSIAKTGYTICNCVDGVDKSQCYYSGWGDLCSGLGCSGSSTSCASSCTSHHHKDCYNDDVYWYDSCGAQEDIYDNCSSGESCSSGECILSCTPNCSGKDCGDDGCGGSCGTCSSGLICSSSGVCILSASSCTSHHHKDCYNDDVYWYDSCGAQEDIYDNCSSGESCSNGECVLSCATGDYYNWTGTCRDFCAGMGGNMEGVGFNSPYYCNYPWTNDCEDIHIDCPDSFWGSLGSGYDTEKNIFVDTECNNNLKCFNINAEGRETHCVGLVTTMCRCSCP